MNSFDWCTHMMSLKSNEYTSVEAIDNHSYQQRNVAINHINNILCF